MKRHRQQRNFLYSAAIRRTKPTTSRARASPSRVSFPKKKRGGGGWWTCLDSRGPRRCTRISSLARFPGRYWILGISGFQVQPAGKRKLPLLLKWLQVGSNLRHLFALKLHTLLRSPWLKIIQTFQKTSCGSNFCTRPQPSAGQTTLLASLYVERKAGKKLWNRPRPTTFPRTKKYERKTSSLSYGWIFTRNGRRRRRGANFSRQHSHKRRAT